MKALEAMSKSMPAAQIANLSKSFGSREILSGIAFTVESGQVHALLGANGAGKSSIVKILAGYYARTTGEITVGGKVAPASAGVSDMAALGIRVVHQDLGLIDGLSILENVAAGGGYVRGRFGQIDWKATAQRVEDALEMVGLSLATDTEVDGLPTWQRVAVACARALYDGLAVVRLLILDEVTAALPPGEVGLILDIVRRLQARGAGILYVTHRFEEVIEIAGWITVLRNGSVFVSRPIDGMTANDLVESVVGHQIVAVRRPAEAHEFGRPVLQMEHVSTVRLRDISLTVRAGEICGVIGRAGCGRSALGRAIYGQERVTDGRLLLDGEPLKVTNPRQSMARGIAYIPQDRQRSGILPRATVRENLTIANLAAISRNGIIGRAREAGTAIDLVERYGVVPSDAEEDIENLSGGNQQKVVVGRWATRDNRLFIFDEPTEGVDAGARHSIYQVIRQRAQSGAAILLLSSSIEEIIETCDRAIVLRDGSIDAEVSGDSMSVKEVERLLMSDHHSNE